MYLLPILFHQAEAPQVTRWGSHQVFPGFVGPLAVLFQEASVPLASLQARLVLSYAACS
jgi:hypothetical protein